MSFGFTVSDFGFGVLGFRVGSLPQTNPQRPLSYLRLAMMGRGLVGSEATDSGFRL